MRIAENILQIKARGLTARQRKNLSYWAFLIPFLVGFVFLFFWIYLDSIRYSFMYMELRGAEGLYTEFYGFKNFTYAFEDLNFINNVRSSISTMFANVILVTLYSLFVAVILSQNIKGRTFFRAVFFIPVILATGFMTKADMNNMIMEQTWDNLGTEIQATGTIANGIFDRMDLQSYLMNLNFSPQLSRFVINAVTGIFDIINISGVQMMIFLAGLQSISPSIYESADIDGATAWESFWLITFPMISPMILVNVIYTIIDSFTRADNPIMLQVRSQSFVGKGGMGQAAAMAWIYFLVALIFIGIFSFIVSRFVYYQQRD